MRYLEMSLISEANAIFNQLEAKNFSINLEAYSCKYTKKQRKRQNYKNTIAHLINTLELANLKGKCKLKRDDFKLKQFSEIKNDIFLILMCNDRFDAEKMIKMLVICIQNTVGINSTLIFSLENRIALLSDDKHFLCYLFYNKKVKRILLLTIFYNLNKR
ncbi:hypothetical protein VCUG_01730 [Vavraia culicis subsp. floridensis]|uniref:Uncharacterized protein n=1 Tax=Vavraia culicis (isolate floridensis) TaxID=948595 RepID=L2GSW9_VAVCU|nr:uncharacterized protein VCUG_01730 [Vavraia culicis subsp. floridensis]ELA46771.1 hypothetical protein VCUG_01730 [Vavraia culicis subsp. floridensis]